MTELNCIFASVVLANCVAAKVVPCMLAVRVPTQVVVVDTMVCAKVVGAQTRCARTIASARVIVGSILVLYAMDRSVIIRECEDTTMVQSSVSAGNVGVGIINALGVVSMLVSHVLRKPDEVCKVATCAGAVQLRQLADVLGACVAATTLAMGQP